LNRGPDFVLRTSRFTGQADEQFLPPVFLPPIDESRGLLRVQVMLIRLQYVLYNPNAGSELVVFCFD
jgi:hypothetical protein